MDIFIQQIINGLVLGSMYALVALGYTMVYGIINLINFAHGEVLLVGPSHAKHELHDFLAAQQPELHRRVLGVENADHPTSGQLVDRARLFFKKADAMQGSPHTR